MSQQQPVKSAGRALEVIDYVSRAGSVSFAELVDALELPRSSAHGLVQTLLSAGWLQRDTHAQRYVLGLHAWQIGQRYNGNRLLLEKATPVMQELTHETGETVQLARLDGVENVYIAISPSTNPMRLASTVGMRLHSHATGIGKALLSTLPPHEAAERLHSVALPRLTPRTETDVERLGAVLERTRFTGFAVDDEEFIDGCRCVAVVVTTEEDTGIASAMSITTPIHRSGAEWPHALVPALRRGAEQIRAALGLPPL